MGELIRQLDLSDIIFSGYGFTIGADIFALLPYIVKNAKGYTWLAFLIGGFISLSTGLSYVRSNLDYPSNDAEYTWIRESFKIKEPKNESDRFINKAIDIFAFVVIWAVIILGITMSAVMVISINHFLKNMNINLPDKLFNLLIVLVPTLLNFLDVKKMSIANMIVTIITSVTLISLPFLSMFKNTHIDELKPKSIERHSLINIIKAIGITILPYNGYQSVVQMSEEVKDIKNIPKGLIISGGMAIILYTLLSVGVISILGVNKTSNSKNPISDAFSVFFGNKTMYIVNLVAVLTGFTTLLLGIYSRSRLLSKLSELNIAPKLFSNYGVNISNNRFFSGIPVYSIIALSILCYLCTLFKENSLEFFTDITNLLTFFVFICVNLGVIYNFYKNKNNDEKSTKEKYKNSLDRITSSYPIYAIIGCVILIILFIKSLKELKDLIV